MPVPASITELSTTAGNNSPGGSESPTTTDDYLRTLSAFIASLRDSNAGKQASNAILTALSGLTGAAGSFPVFTGVSGMRVAPIIGTVSQSSGVPSGALIESGSNANGRYRKYACGLLICTKSGSASGSGTTWTFPAGFATASVPPIVSVTPSAGALPRYATTSSPTASSVVVYGWQTGGASSGVTVELTAIGYWFT